MTRREFLGAAASTAVAPSGTANQDAAARPSARLIASAPVLMNAAESSVGVAFAVSADASGWVDVSLRPDMGDAMRVYSGTGAVMRVDARFATIRTCGLRPATRYYYRIGADRIAFDGDYNRSNLGS